MLRAFKVSIYVRNSEDRSVRQEQILRLGKVRYTLLFGTFGIGFGIGLTSAVGWLIMHNRNGWRDAVFNLIFWMAVSTWYFGVRAWNESFREVPFPSLFSPQK